MKVWVIIYWCMNSGSIYTNIASKQDTEAFLTAWENFIHVRGKQQYLWWNLLQEQSMSPSKKRRITTYDVDNWGWNKIIYATNWMFAPVGSKGERVSAASRCSRVVWSTCTSDFGLLVTGCFRFVISPSGYLLAQPCYVGVGRWWRAVWSNRELAEHGHLHHQRKKVRATWSYHTQPAPHELL